MVKHPSTGCSQRLWCELETTGLHLATEKIKTCYSGTNVVLSSKNSSINRKSLLLLRQVSILYLAKVLGNASVDSACGQAFTNTLNFSFHYFTTLGLIKNLLRIQGFPKLRCNAVFCAEKAFNFFSLSNHKQSKQKMTEQDLTLTVHMS